MCVLSFSCLQIQVVNSFCAYCSWWLRPKCSFLHNSGILVPIGLWLFFFNHGPIWSRLTTREKLDGAVRKIKHIFQVHSLVCCALHHHSMVTTYISGYQCLIFLGILNARVYLILWTGHTSHCRESCMCLSIWDGDFKNGGSRSGGKSPLACDMLAPLKCSMRYEACDYPYVIIVITWVSLNPGAQRQISWFELEYFSSLMYGTILFCSPTCPLKTEHHTKPPLPKTT